MANTLPTNGAGSAGTLNKFGVPVIPGANQGSGILMPKLKYRYAVYLQNFGNGQNTTQQNITQQVVSCGRPQIQYNRTDLHSYNNVMFIPQKPVWQTIELVIRDDITSVSTASVGEQLQKQMNFFSMTTGMAGINYKFTMQILMLDGNYGTLDNTDSSLETWHLEGCYLETVAYDNTDYSSSDPVQITLTVSFDNATQIINPPSENDLGTNDPGNLPGVWAGGGGTAFGNGTTSI